MGAVVFFSKSEDTARACPIMLGLQVVPFVLGPIYSAFEDYQTNRSLQGDDTFRGPQRALAHAIKAGDLAKVKELIPSVGNLNKEYKSESLLRFAVFNNDLNGLTLEIVQALLDAGADPSGPGGPVGAWLILLVPSVMLTALLLVFAGKGMLSFVPGGRPVQFLVAIGAVIALGTSYFAGLDAGGRVWPILLACVPYLVWTGCAAVVWPQPWIAATLLGSAGISRMGLGRRRRLGISAK